MSVKVESINDSTTQQFFLNASSVEVSELGDWREFFVLKSADGKVVAFIVPQPGLIVSTVD